MTLAEALRLMGTLADAFPRQELRDGTLEVYARDLLDLDIEIGEAAAAHVRRTSTFFPSIAELRNAAAEIRLAAPPSMEAWKQANGKSTADRHPLVNEAREIVGDNWYWRTAPADSLRPAFIGAYKEVRAAAVANLAAPPPQLGASKRREIASS